MNQFWLLQQLGDFCFVLQFFVEDPGGSGEEVMTTTPPVNITNDSLLENMEENTGENKFYLPVSTTGRGHQYGWEEG